MQPGGRALVRNVDARGPGRVVYDTCGQLNFGLQQYGAACKLQPPKSTAQRRPHMPMWHQVCTHRGAAGTPCTVPHAVTPPPPDECERPQSPNPPIPRSCIVACGPAGPRAHGQRCLAAAGAKCSMRKQRARGTAQEGRGGPGALAGSERAPPLDATSLGRRRRPANISWVV